MYVLGTLAEPLQNASALCLASCIFPLVVLSLPASRLVFAVANAAVLVYLTSCLLAARRPEILANTAE